MEFNHISVLLNETIEALNIRPDGIYADGTAGGAGHSKEIAKRLLKSLEKRMSDIEIGMTFDDSVIDFVSKAGYDKIYGARPLKRAIQTNIEDVLSEKILDKSIEKGKSYICSMENDELKVESVKLKTENE